MIKTKWTTLGTIGAALLASSCCIGPLVLAGLGLGAVGVAGALERFRPLFIVIALAVLGVGFYLTYRKRSTECQDGVCVARATSRWSRASLWIVGIVVLAILFFPNWSPVLLGTKSENIVDGNAITLTVTGMTCAGCTLNVQRALEGVSGVSSASVELDAGVATVRPVSEGLETDSLLAAVRRAGYDASVTADAATK
jgi:mercuric ion transport protein